MKHMTLQLKLTLLTALILLLTTSALTWISVSSAQSTLIAPLLSTSTMQPSPSPSVSSESTFSDMDNAWISPSTAIEAKKLFDFRLIVFDGIVTLVGVIAVYFVTGHVLRPLHELSQTVKEIDENSLSNRLPQNCSKDEVGILTTCFNQMLQRIEDAFVRQKRFTANAAHELKTPLAVIKTTAQVLEQDDQADLECYRQNNQRLILNVDRLAGVVDDLLVMVSIGEYVIEKQPVQLDALLDAIQDEYAPMLEQKQIQYVTSVGDLCVCSNPEFLYQILSNLIVNACKYGNAGGSIHVDAHAAKQEVVIKVSDDGPGIAAEHLPYLFDAFYRVDKSRSREMGGSGLGLALVKTITDALHGTITVQSGLNKGTCFTITLPQ